MKNIKPIAYGLFYVTSEPGDSTRYDYLIYRDGPNEFTFAPRNSAFRYPQRINKFETNIEQIAERENCNYWTVSECLNSIKKITNVLGDYL